jgi:hypothetical protein
MASQRRRTSANDAKEAKAIKEIDNAEQAGKARQGAGTAPEEASAEQRSPAPASSRPPLVMPPSLQTSARLLSLTPVSETLREKAKARAFDATIFETNPPAFFTAQISNNSVDAYYTRMAPSTLQNFAADARRGISFQDAHETASMASTLGASLDARYIEEGNEARVEADMFTISGTKQSDDFILKLRAGIARDVSVGFYGGSARCSMCGLDLWRDWDCPHIPGFTYEREERDSQGNVLGTVEETAVAWIEDAHLAEVSTVYDGATPGCAIIKAQIEADAGRLTPEAARMLTTRYRSLNLTFQTTEINAMAEKKRSTPETVPVEVPPPPTIQSNVEQAPEIEEQRIAANAELTDEELEALDAALQDAEVSEDGRKNRVGGIRELLALAKEGRAYRLALVEEALTEGVRCFGNDFKPELYRSLFVNAGLEQIRSIRDEWKKQASAIFPGTRQSVADTAVPEKEVLPRREMPLPAAVYG